MITADQIICRLEGQLSRGLFRHVYQVAQTAEKMAMRFKEDLNQAFLAGILHDYAKERPVEELVAIAKENNLLDEIFLQVPFLLHAPVGAILIKRELEIKDEKILDAVGSHSLGRPCMGKLEKIIYLADMIEPDRDYSGVGKLRDLCCHDLDQAMLAALNSTLEYCLKQERFIHPQTINTRNYFLRLDKMKTKQT